ncbi:Hypothetical predicted protein [Mytilus galloprovincialis]|uniref:Uncharacterized protein n=1 Tax=Mytilus galloprovincialis TaxID=29158 RepID=A0A8B6EWL4_MYTGA|nr:Hypothetical predicted protein [Mytilus galloprovincialis]
MANENKNSLRIRQEKTIFQFFIIDQCVSNKIAVYNLVYYRFWSILGGLFGAGILLIFLMYIICKFKSPNSCLSDEHVHDAEMFEEERHEINTVTHQQSHHQPRFYIRRESFWKITRRKSLNSNIVCRQCEQTRERNQDKNNKTRKDDVETKKTLLLLKTLPTRNVQKRKLY